MNEEEVNALIQSYIDRAREEIKDWKEPVSDLDMDELIRQEADECSSDVEYYTGTFNLIVALCDEIKRLRSL